MPRSLVATTPPAECLVAGSRALPELLERRLRATPRRVAYRWRNGTDEQSLTWEAFAAQVARYRAAFAVCGLHPGERVAICARNRIEWLLFEQAALACGFVVVPLFFNDRVENLQWCLTDSGARLILLEDGSHWPSLSLALPELAAVFLGDTLGAMRAQDLMSWLGAGGDAPPPVPGDPAALATIVYTSGTTGRPKGVQLTHGNLLADIEVLLMAVPELADSWQRTLSFLPLSHMFERTLGEYVSLSAGWELCFADSIQTLSADLKWARPTVLVAVPRVFEKIYQRLNESLVHTPLRRLLFRQAVRLGWRRFRGRLGPAAWLPARVLDGLIGRRVRALFGGRLRAVFLGGAPMPRVLIECFMGLGVTLLQGYGLTETAPVVTCNRLGDNEPFSVGRPLRDVETRITGDGELWLRGPMVMPGYWQDPLATQAVLTEDGWFRTGDLAREQDGRIYISGRRKEIIVLSNGEKIAPADAEQAILGDAAFSQVLLVGEGRAALALLAVTTLQDPQVARQRANAQLHRFPGYARVRHVLLLDTPWTVEQGQLTPTLKLKRDVIERQYAQPLEALYAGVATDARPGQPVRPPADPVEIHSHPHSSA